MEEPNEMTLHFRMNESVVPNDVINDVRFFPLDKSSIPVSTVNVQSRTVTTNLSQLEITIQVADPHTQDDQFQLSSLSIKCCRGNIHELLTFALRLSSVYSLICEEIEVQKGKINQPLFTQKMDIALSDQIDEIILYQKLFLCNSEDPEVLHQLRIRLRQMRSYLWCLRPLLKKKKIDLWRTQLKDCTRLTSQVRELDVLIRQWTDDSGNVQGTKNKVMNLITEVTRKRELAAEELKAQLSTGILTPVLLTIRNEVTLTHRSFDDSSAIGVKVVKQVRKRYKKCRHSVKELDLTKITDVHHTRIEGKKIHYSLVLIEPLMNKKIKPVIAELKYLQDQLGHYCDTSKNQTILKEIRENSTEPLIVYECAKMEGLQEIERQEIINKFKKIKLHKSIKKQWQL